MACETCQHTEAYCSCTSPRWKCVREISGDDILHYRIKCLREALEWIEQAHKGKPGGEGIAAEDAYFALRGDDHNARAYANGQTIRRYTLQEKSD